MATEKSCNLLEKRVVLPRAGGSGTISSSAEGIYRINTYRKDLGKLAIFWRWAKGSRRAESEKTIKKAISPIMMISHQVVWVST